AENCYDSLRFTNNKIHLQRGGVGIYQDNNYGEPGNEGIIANNFIYAGGDGNNASGIFSYSSSYQNYYHNSILITNLDFYSYAFRVRYSNDIRIHNNIFANHAGGLVMNFSDDPASSAISSDYNDLYTTGDAAI